MAAGVMRRQRASPTPMLARATGGPRDGAAAEATARLGPCCAGGLPLLLGRPRSGRACNALEAAGHGDAGTGRSGASSGASSGCGASSGGSGGTTDAGVRGAGDGCGASSPSSGSSRAGGGGPASRPLDGARRRGRSFSSVSSLGDRSHLEVRAGKIAVSGRYHEQTHRIEQDYDIHRAVCGVGQSGQVRVATRRGSPRGRRRYAVKAFDVAAASEFSRNMWAGEVEVFLCMDHPHIARLYDVYDQGNMLYLVMELMEGGELFDRVVKQRAFSEPAAVESTTQILWALNYLHKHNVVHRDLKPENIVFDRKDSSVLKLIDFGFSRIWEPGVNMEAEFGSPGYMAPEVLTGSYTSQCDLWSLGVIVFVMLCGYAPFPGSRAEKRANIRQGKFHMCPKRWAHVSKDAQAFTRSLLVVDPSSRLSARAAMDHPWLAQQHPTSFWRREAKLNGSVVTALREFGRASKFRRCCLEMIAWSLSSEECEGVLEHFRAMDQSRQGTITLSELQAALRRGFGVPDSEVRQIFTAMDTNSDEDRNPLLRLPGGHGKHPHRRRRPPPVGRVREVRRRRFGPHHG
ncbi:unnamed protein product [Prorocentrum cordatum]|uniref:Non-specific serine/threonine protein kinase n=1 Tax=Prorocentrum cordatum TaxID=2364126 RepID=A0ABN9Q7U0_9DINO|nr:unnamed protein product [Polarella glacialis]